MSKPRRRTVVAVDLDTEQLVDDIIRRLEPLLVGRASAEPAAAAATSLAELCASVGLSPTFIKSEIAAGRLKAVKAGTRVLITAEARTEWLASLPSAMTQKKGGTNAAQRENLAYEQVSRPPG